MKNFPFAQPPGPGRETFNKKDFDLRSNKLRSATNRSETVEECRSLLRDYPREPLAHFLLSRALTEGERKKEALPYAEAAYKLEGSNAQYVLYLGLLYHELRLNEFALPLLRKAVKLFPENYLMHSSLADCYEQINQGDRAIACFETAIEKCKDREMAERLWAKAASSLTMAGKFEDAKKYIDKLLTCKGTAYHFGVRDAASAAKGGADSPEGRRLAELIADEDVPEERRSDLMLTMGRLYEKDKNYDEAFKWWMDARAIKRKKDWTIRDHTKMDTVLKRFYTPQLVEAAEPFGHPSEEPVFIVGMPRSGTTLTEQIIAAHPLATGVGELARFIQLDAAFRSDYRMENRIAQLQLNGEKGELKARAQETLRIFDVVADRPRQRTVEKTPHNFYAVGYLRTTFPKAKFIHLRRNPLDGFISAFQNNLNRTHAYSYDQETYLLEYLAQDGIMRYWKKLYPDQIMTLHYEDLAQDTEHWARAIIDHIGLPWDDECLKFYEKAKTVRTISYAQVRAPVHTSSVEKWRRYEKHLGPILRLIEKSGFVYRTEANAT